MPDKSTLSELTVTCNQCGSTSMERLDAKEYRCKNCGAVTVINDDDAERLEAMLTKVLNTSSQSSRAPGRVVSKPALGMVAGIAAVVSMAVVFTVFSHSIAPSKRAAYRADSASGTVPPSEVTLTPLHVDNPATEPAYYVGLLYNHSGYPIDVPRYHITYFPNGMKGDSTTSDAPLNRLLPGEYQPVRFMAFRSQLGGRYEIEPVTRIDRNTDEIARPPFLQQQLVHHVDHGYELAGVIQNTFTRPIEHVRVMAIFYGPDNEQIGTDTAVSADLRPGEKSAIDLTIWPRQEGAQVSAYEYLVDANFADTAERAAARSSASSASAAASAVSASRIVRVDHPHVRTIASDVNYTLEDLLSKPENAPQAPDFDFRSISITTPRRLTTEKLDTVYLGEMVNNSPDQVAITPQVTLTLTRDGRKVDAAERAFPDLVPGAHIPVFFHYEGEARAFNGTRFDWKAAKSYRLNSPGHAQLATTLQSQTLESSDSLKVAIVRRFSFVRVHGTVTNKGDRAVKDITVYVLLRDAKGRLTGYDRQVLSDPLQPGETAQFDGAPSVWGDAYASAEAVSLPSTAPSL